MGDIRPDDLDIAQKRHQKETLTIAEKDAIRANDITIKAFFLCLMAYQPL